MMKMEEEASVGGDLMECEEEEPLSSERHEKEKESRDEAADLRTDPRLIRTMTVPLDPVQSCGTAADGLLKSAGCTALSFSINGRLVPPLPGGGSIMLTLRGLPRGSACGFTSVQAPISPKPLGPVGPFQVGSSTAHGGGHTPIITGVVSGEAAHRVLSGNRDLFTSSRPANTSSEVPDSPSPKSKPHPKKKPALRHKLLRKGEQIPPECLVCRSSYKLISELRGFLCMCSPAVTHSLKELKRRRIKPVRRSKEENKTCKKRRVSADDVPIKVISPLRSPRTPHSLTSPARSLSPMQVDQIVALSLDPPPQGKLVILVEDFYYGSTPENTPSQPLQKVCRPYHCTQCPETLQNNISLMSHMQQHHSTASQQSASSCPHCLRHFLPLSRLQKHMEQAHVCKSTVTCRICELAFNSEPDFLWHMRTTHKPGEMPYTCQVCDFRSSFYSDVWTHFQSVHANTRNLLCHFCLRVLRKTSCYQQHLAHHQCKRSFSCEKCRLHFLYIRELLEHKTLKHTTHVKPPQLSGLKPGTKVTVRTYSMVGGIAPCKVVDVPSPPPQPLPPPKRRRVESLRQLLWSVNPDRDSGCSLRCTECLSSILDLKVHFPSVVTCSLCRFSTCCSASYANHMLSHHAANREQQSPNKPLNILTPKPSLPEPLKCVSCTLFTYKGDVMATHLMERPQHSCIRLTHTGIPSGQSVCLEDIDTTTKRQTHTPSTSEHDQDTIDIIDSVTSLPARTGAFIPIQLDFAHQSFSQLSVKPLTAPSPPSFSSAMTIMFLGPRRWKPEQPELRPLSQSQLAVVLSSLCQGVSQAALLFQMSTETIQSWTALQRSSLPHRKCLSRTESMTKWVLSQREKHLRLDEDLLLLMAKTTMELEGKMRTTWGQGVQMKMIEHGGKMNEGRDGRTLKIQRQAGQRKRSGEHDGQTKTSEEHNGQTKTSEGRAGQTVERQQDGQTKFLWTEEELLTCYNLTVDFMLRQELGQNHNQRTLTRNLQRHRYTFIHSLCSEIRTRQLPPQSVGCIDEFPLFLDLNLYKKQDQLALQFSKARNERPLLEVVLSALSDGTFLTPLLCFTGYLVPIPAGFPNNVMLEARPQGFTHQERMNIWIKKVWRPHVTSRFRGPSLLIVDPYRGPQSMRFRSRMSSLLTAVHYIPEGCCFSLQPLDVCVTPILRDFLEARWTQLVSEGGLDGLSLDHLALTLACWFSEVSSILTSEPHFLSRSFSSVLDLQQTKDPTKVEKMIADLTQAMIQPLETRGPGGVAEPGPGGVAGPGPGGVAGPGGGVLKEVKAEKEELLVDSLSAFHHVFKGDSDTESFHGFPTD